ncbi:hypothetical protein M0R45_029885 [Rubus argutus]|uniref:Uncharacterized protein n=1 Tax=Rubus argutus TaxID=59490 RepID=A0AAW1WCZ8_RUBAR
MILAWVDFDGFPKSSSFGFEISQAPFPSWMGTLPRLYSIFMESNLTFRRTSKGTVDSTYVGFWGICGPLVLMKKWRYAYYRYLDNVQDRFHVMIAQRMARMRE